MNIFNLLQRHLSLKIFLSYLVVILVLIVVLVSAAIFVAPGAFERHLTAMERMTEGEATSSGVDLEADLFSNFRIAVTESLRLAAIAAFIAAASVSIFVSRRIVAPIQRMMSASQRIAEGHYDNRVELPGGKVSADLDELGQLALSFNQMADKLLRTEDLRRQLIGDVAHELRTPLTTIQGSMEGLLDGVLHHSEETYQQVLYEATRLQKLVRDLQELSRVEAEAFVLDPHQLDVGRLVETARLRLAIQFQEKGVDLSLDMGDKLPMVMADEDRIGQVLLNLLGNSLQYTQSGGNVRVSSKTIGDSVQVQIEDTGIGISAEHIPHVFARFYRVDKSRSRVGGGSGIGLTIAKHIIEQSGGDISVKSAGVGKGSTFTFTLPIA